jgi:quinol monooxygenase YgiN
LLPVIATQELKLSALGYGVLLGSIGVGAVGGVPLLARLRDRYSLDWIVTAMTIVYALTTLALAYIHNIWLLNGAMLVTGATWLVLTSCLNVAAQTIVPNWVQARALGVYLLVFQGCFAAGSAAWGAAAGRVGNSTALLYAAIGLVVGIVTMFRWHLRSGEDLDLSPSQHLHQPETVIEPAPQDGPVMVQIEYRIRTEEEEKFVAAMDEVKPIRLRDGAFRWELFCDPTEPGRYIETFEVASWGEHMRQHERTTIMDQEIEQQALQYQETGASPIVNHLVAARALSATLNHNNP